MDLRARLAWCEEYSVGVGRIDRQHRRVLETVAELGDLVAGAGGGRLTPILDRLEDYARTHFAEEEALARRLPASSENRILLLSQCSEHADYRRRLDAYRSAMGEGRSDAEELLAFVGRWWLCHILGADMALGRRLVEHGID